MNLARMGKPEITEEKLLYQTLGPALGYKRLYPDQDSPHVLP